MGKVDKIEYDNIEKWLKSGELETVLIAKI